MFKPLRIIVLLLVSMSCALFATGCSTSVITDPNFHTWCGDELCAWKLESGEIRKAPTWHKKDFGVELLEFNAPSTSTTISQRVDQSPGCLEFSVIADVAAEAQVSIAVDFGADGTIDYEQPIAALGFREQKTQITAPVAYSGIKFIISKKGSGRAVLAQMDVEAKDGHCAAAPVKAKPQSIGSRCPLGRDDKGEYAWDGAVCASGLCCQGLCAECCGDRRPSSDAGDAGDAGDADGGSQLPEQINVCAKGETCRTVDLPSKTLYPYVSAALPRQCDPGMRERESGKECLLPDDCASGVCEGAEWTMVNTQVERGPCPTPPVRDPACHVSFVHGGRCR